MSVSALDVLTAMITPAVLISACGTLIFSSSARLGRVINRVRALSHEFETLVQNAPADPISKSKLSMMSDQIPRLTRRVKLLQSSMTALYLSVGIFVTTSFSIGLTAITQQETWLPVILGLAGSLFLLYGSVLLILEARTAVHSTYKEMDFLREMHSRLIR